MSDQSIGFEPSGHDAPTDLVIQGCIINHTNRTPAVTLIGISGPETLVRCKFTGNIVLGSQIFCTDAHQVTIQHNVVIVSSPERGNRIQAQVQRGGDPVLVTHNLLMNDQIGTPAMASLGEVNQRQVPRAGRQQFLLYPFWQRHPMPVER